MFEMKVNGEMTAVRLPDGSSGKFTGDIDGLYQGYREVGPPEQTAAVQFEHGTLALALRYEVPARPTGERTENPFADGNDPFEGLTLLQVTRPAAPTGRDGPPPWMQGEGGPPPWMQGEGGPPPWMQGEGGPPPWMRGEGGPPPWMQGEDGAPPWMQGEGGPPPWMQGEGGPPPWMQGEGGPPPWMQGQGGASPAMEGQGDPSKWGSGRAVVAHSIKLEVDGEKSTGIYAGASGEMTVEAPNHKTAGYMMIDTDSGRLRLNFLEWYEEGQLVASLWPDGEASTGTYRQAKGELRFSLGFYAAMDPQASTPVNMCAKGTYSGTLWLEEAPETHPQEQPLPKTGGGGSVAEKITWTSDAQDAVKQVPIFVRGRAKKAAENEARERGESVVSVDIFRAAMEKIVPPGMRKGGPPGA
jgi:Proto-chlorophyllide reductase 57 kD subunit